jgi:hypothetical protein
VRQSGDFGTGLAGALNRSGILRTLRAIEGVSQNNREFYSCPVIHFSVATAATYGHQSLLVKCLPDTVDPRGVKGK